MEQPVARERQDLGRVDRARLQQLVGQGPCQTLRRLDRARSGRAVRSGRASSRSRAVRSRRDRRARRPTRTRCGPSRAASSTTPTQNPARSNWSSGMTPGCSAVSPPRSAHPARRQPSATPSTIVATRSGTTLPPRGSRGRTAARRPVHTTSSAHIATRSMPTVSRRPVIRAISSLVPTPSVAAASTRPPRSEQPREPADLVGHLGAAGSRGQIGDQRDGLGGGLGVDPGPAVRVAHRAFTAVGSCSWSSSTNLPACAGIATGYSPSKHARQKSSFGEPAAWTMPSSER